MTIWKAGDLAVCVIGGVWWDFDGSEIPGPDVNDISRVTRVYIDDEQDLMLVLAEWSDPEGYLASEFRPAVQDWQSETQSHATKLHDLVKATALKAVGS